MVRKFCKYEIGPIFHGIAIEDNAVENYRLVDNPDLEVFKLTLLSSDKYYSLNNLRDIYKELGQVISMIENEDVKSS